MNDIIRIVIVDDNLQFREAVVDIFQKDLRIEVVGQGATAEEAVDLARDLSPDIILLDIHMPGDGITSAGTVTRSFPATKVVMLTGSQDEDDMTRAFGVGVCAYILKGVTGRELVRMIHDVSDGRC
jgi:two-component system, NarL family, nitrate/nitrite response regulator NarL